MRFGSSAVSRILIVLSGAALGGAVVTTATALTTPPSTPSFHQLAPLNIEPAPDWFHPAHAPQQAPAPVKLVIPSLNISAAVQALGVTVDYSLQAPEGTSEVGWYRLGASPGSPGNAIISGHLGYPGVPAVFSTIPRLHDGDEVEVQFADGTAVRFAVDRVFRTPYRNLPSGFFATDGPPRLTLITCIGDYRANELTYSDRLVVEARPVPIHQGEI
ncbi:MAG: hypothetical protein NVS1B3_06280 [Candidatus Dormibacteraceae bacterium]